LGQWWVKSHFVTADVVFAIDRAGLYGGELASTQQRHSVPLGVHCEFHGSWDYFFCVTQKFTSHLVRERDQCCALLWSRLVVDEEDSLRRIRIRVGISQGSVGMHGGGHCQAIQSNAIPTAALDVPRENGFIAYEIHFAIGEALTRVDVGAAGLDVVSANLLGQSGRSKS
jgi:hypothetical protein